MNGPLVWRFLRRRRLGVACLLATLVSGVTAWARQPFVATDLGALDGSSFALDISDTGVVVGYSGAEAFRWTRREGMIGLGTLGGDSSIASAVNDRGTLAVGASMTAEDAQHAFVWNRARGMVDLGTLAGRSAGSYATGVNDDGLVVGFSWYQTSDDEFADYVTHGFAWTSADGIADIGTFGGDTYPNAVNKRGLVVGTGYTEGNAASHPFAWTQDGGLIDLGSLGGVFGEALAVSDSDVVVGYSYTAEEVSHPHPFVWTRERGMIDLGTLGAGTSGYARAVNDDGVVVGDASTNGNDAIRAFRWTAADGISVLDPLDGRESSAAGISRSGLVVGNHLSADGGGLLGFAWTQADGTVDLNPVGQPYSQIDSVNRHGVVLGFSYGPGGVGRATVWQGAKAPAPMTQPTRFPVAAAGENAGTMTGTWN
jgi:probable HAF family extracellular repeat protein